MVNKLQLCTHVTPLTSDDCLFKCLHFFNSLHTKLVICLTGYLVPYLQHSSTFETITWSAHSSVPLDDVNLIK